MYHRCSGVWDWTPRHGANWSATLAGYFAWSRGAPSLSIRCVATGRTAAITCGDELESCSPARISLPASLFLALERRKESPIDEHARHWLDFARSPAE
ncbi:hypothetical protein Pla52o_01450 [Novipirellula galeiformis]|uniref:Uncharacterized protein n=1 Tax=Novipirellula galeiformis TaxID=2528004 RepID=A0A5C6CPB2_9BACT|nr:hypothetical protein Pla52o_01450 [Novipirellula galeiformis]